VLLLIQTLWGRIMKRLLLASVAAVALYSSQAAAADLGVRRAAPAPMAEPAFSWNGFYIGYNSGGARGDITTAFQPLRQDTAGGLVGGQIGYNWQTGPWVFGIEADYDYANISGTAHGCPVIGLDCSSRLRSFATVRGKVGYAVRNINFYATGGYAGGSQRINVDGVLGGIVAAPVLVSASSREWLNGWTAGAGIEWAPWGGNLITKIEALYFDLHSEDFASVPAEAGHRGVLVRTGLSYKFNWAPPVAVMASY
jgi:outer membrane immunogenic protein